MTQPAISAVGLTKRYNTAQNQSIDAVRNVSFEIGRGDAVGLIGRNAAGKSTLLKLLSRVTRPTAGYADVYGHVGALLEVGTGFHPDLTGRENTFLSGAIFGLSRAEVRSRFDEIVAFAEIEQFIDMPVKRYSSGMFARLGFAVAAHLRPEILIVDEVLAVGDLPFQAKCLALMHSLTDNGTTVLFVSHNLLAVADLCSRALVMAEGSLLYDGATSDAITAYQRTFPMGGVQEGIDHRPPHVVRVNGQAVGDIIECRPNEAMRIELGVDLPSDAPTRDIALNLVIETPDGRMAVHLRSDLDSTSLTLGPGQTTLTINLQDLPLSPGSYSMYLRVVALRTANPFIWDTDRRYLVVAGDARLDSIVQPRYQFGQRANAGSPSEARRTEVRTVR